MRQISKIFKCLIPMFVFLVLSGCGGTDAGETGISEINTTGAEANTAETGTGEAGTDEEDTGEESYNAYPTCLPDVLPDYGEQGAGGEEYADTPKEAGNWTVPQLYARLTEELGTDHVGGIYYISENDSYGIWLTQETFDEWESRELTDCELALKQAEEEGRVFIRAGKYSLEELYTFRELVKPLFCGEDEVGIYAAGINEEENKIRIYAYEEADFAKLYELVPEDAVCLELFSASLKLEDL